MNVGILGGGQLARMLALAGYPLGLRFRFLDPALDAPAGQLAEHIAGSYADKETLDRFARGLDVITYEFENVPADAVQYLSNKVPVFPPVIALEVAQDRLNEKNFFRRLNIPTPQFEAVHSLPMLESALTQIGYPAVLKTRRFGYDGKGQQILQSTADAANAWQNLHGQNLILEDFVPFEMEASIIAVRSASGDTKCYPLIENVHREGILRLSRAPIGDSQLQKQAEEHAGRVLEELHYVGVLAIEFFVYEGTLIANEMAPRVHNSGHWTIEGAETSQFGNHLRAVLGLPLGSTTLRGHSAMVNLIGTLPVLEDILRTPEAYLHLYGKEPRAGRKLGHVTCIAADRPLLERKLKEVAAALKLPEGVASRQ